MSGYIISVMTATAVVALGGLVSYGGSTAKISRAAMAMVLLYTVTLPIISVTGDLSELISTDYFEDVRVEYDPTDTLFYERTAAAFSDGVKKFVCGEHHFDYEDVTVIVRGFDVENMRAEKIIIILNGRAAMADARSVAGRVENAGLGECEVKIDLAG